MINIRHANERGTSQIDWLDSKHTFSFGNYHDPMHMGFGHLRVINEDVVQPRKGFGKHAHQNMEIISYVIEGELAHQDSMGTGSVIRPGEIQRMSAGTGVQHSEFNRSDTNPLHFLQIWIVPDKNNIEPSYEQKIIPKNENQLILIGSNQKTENAIMIHQDIKLFSAHLTKTHTLNYMFVDKRTGWIQLIKGSINVNGKILSAGDGASIVDEKAITILSLENSEFLLFDL